MYNVNYTQESIEDLKRLQKNEPKIFDKARRFIAELAEHPKTGLGHPEPAFHLNLDRGNWTERRN